MSAASSQMQLHVHMLQDRKFHAMQAGKQYTGKYESPGDNNTAMIA